MKKLDTTDPIWNLRLTYTPRKSRWLFTVHYAVSASGRTVTYSNTLPRYMLLTAHYRLNIQPKK